MPAVSDPRVEMTRKEGARIQSMVLQRLAIVTQDHAADCMGVSASTVSRLVSEQLERVCRLMAATGLQVTTTGAVVVEPEEMRALKRMALKYLQADLAADLPTPTGEDHE